MLKLLLIFPLILVACSANKPVCHSNTSTPSALKDTTTVIHNIDTVYVSNTKKKRKQKLVTQNEQLSYAVGIKYAKEFTNAGISLNMALLTQAIHDASSNEKSLLTSQQADSLLVVYSKAIDSAATSNKEIRGKNYAEQGRLFLLNNKQKEGVVSLESGLQYKILKKGSGSKPTSKNKVTCHYRGNTINNVIFDSTYETDSPLTFPLNATIPGWKEALLLMPVGSKWQLFIPPSLAYGDAGAGSKIPPHSVLIFELELISIQ